MINFENFQIFLELIEILKDPKYKDIIINEDLLDNYKELKQLEEPISIKNLE